MTVHTSDSFAFVLKQYRIVAGYTQDELAWQAGISERTISDLERGLIRYPHQDTVHRLAVALRLVPVQQDYLIAAAQRPRVARLPFFAPTEAYPLALIGRETEMERLRSLVIRPDVRLVTVLGPAGVGKTRIASELALRVQKTFSDGVAFIALERITAAPLVLSEIAQQLAVREQAHQPMLASLVEALGNKEALLVLDNFEQVVGAATDIAALLARCPQLVVLVTSRFALGVHGEHQFVLAPLAVPPATETAPQMLPQCASVALFCECLLLGHPPAMPSPTELITIGHICRAIDGLPLAIRLAASLTPRYLLAELLVRLTATSELPPSSLGDLPERQASLARAMAWGYDLLDAATQHAFRNLSVFVGGATREAIFALIDAPPNEALAALDALIQHSLLTLWETTPHSRYLMLATLRAFAQQMLAATPEAASIAARHALYFAEFVTLMGPVMNSPDQPLALAQLGVDRDNIRAALAWATEHDAAGIGLRMLGILWRFWHIQGYLTEGRTWTERMLAAAAGTAPSLISGQAFYGASILANEQGDYTRAAVLAQEALAIFQLFDNMLGIAAVQNLAGSIARYQGDFDTAAQRFTEAQGIYETLGNVAGIALAYNNLGTIAVEHGAYDEAQHCFERSLAIKRAGMDPRAIALTLNNLGDALQFQSNFAKAEQCYQESESLFEQIADRQGMSITLMNQGDLAHYAHHEAEALDYYTRAHVALEEMGDRQGVALLALKCAQALLGTRAFTEARQAIIQSMQIYGAEQNDTQIAHCFDVLALLHGKEGHDAASVRLMALAHQMRLHTGTLLVPGERAILAHWRARMQIALGDASYASHWHAGTRLDAQKVLAIALATNGNDATQMTGA